MTARAICTNCGVLGPVNMRIADAGTVRQRPVFWCADHDPGTDTPTCECCGLPGHEKPACLQSPNPVATKSFMGVRTRPMLPVDETFVAAMWEKKCAWQDHFAHAELLVDVNRPDLGVSIKAGATVLITMISRFGDVGIRGKRIHDVRHGYDVRVMPDLLQGYRWAAASPDPPEVPAPLPRFLLVQPKSGRSKPTGRSTSEPKARKGRRSRGRR